jgi:hypothetical protein
MTRDEPRTESEVIVQSSPDDLIEVPADEAD